MRSMTWPAPGSTMATASTSQGCQGFSAHSAASLAEAGFQPAGDGSATRNEVGEHVRLKTLLGEAGLAQEQVIGALRFVGLPHDAHAPGGNEKLLGLGLVEEAHLGI